MASVPLGNGQKRTLASAAQAYHSQLAEDAEALAYLESRGLAGGRGTGTPEYGPDRSVVEEWRPVARDPWYEVSNLGRIRSWVGWRGWKRATTPTVLKPVCGDGRYFTVALRGSRVYLHQLVAEAFHGERPSPRHVARHLNDVKLDNRAENLAWGTRRDNVEDGKRNGRVYGQRGEDHKSAVLTDERVRAIRAWRSYGFEGAEIASWYGISSGLVYNIAKRKRWAHVE